MLSRPESLQDARKFQGTTFEKLFTSSPGRTGEWFQGTITKASDKLRGTAEEGKRIFEGLFFHVRYSDGDREDLEWEEIFSGAADIRALKLPPAIENDLDNFVDTAVAQPDTAFKACHGGLMSLSSPALDRVQLTQSAACAARHGALTDSAHRLAGHMRGADDGENRPPNRPMRDLEPLKKRAHDVEEQQGGTPQEMQEPTDGDSDSEQEGAQPAQAAKRQCVQPSQQHRRKPSQFQGSQQNLRSFPPVPPGPNVGRAGQIKLVHAENFMCHKNFDVDFGPHLNFISGENGSGKSAALQCLQVCLGVQARLTGRARSGKELINDNAATATAKVVLWNTREGSEAYQYDRYGPTITITRKMYRSGASQYYLAHHDSTGLGESVKKGAIDAMLEHFSIDAANPVICLTQDHARAFAGSQSDEHKYQLFMKAMGFEAIMQRQNASDAQIQTVKEHLQKWRAKLQEKRTHVEGLTRKLDDMADVSNWQEEVAELDKCIAWCDALRLREEVQQQTAAIEGELPAKVLELKAQLDEKAGEVKQANDDLIEKQDAKTASHEAAGSAKDDLRKLAREQRDAGKAHSAASHQAGQAAAAVADKRAELEAVRESNQELQEQQIQETQAEAASHAGQVRDGQYALEEAVSRAACATQALHEAEMRQEQIEGDVRSRQTELRRQSDQERRLKDDMQTLRRSQGDPVIAFGGQRVKALLNKIEAAMRQRRFSQRPIGPLGSLLSLTDDKWAVAVETAIGKCFNDFLVANMSDLELLKDLMRQAGIPKNWFPTVHIVTYGLPRHNLGSKPQPPADVTTMMQVLQLPTDGSVGAAISNFLVDFHHVEKRILVETSHDGLRMLRTTHKHLFRNQTIFDAHDVRGWRGYTKGESESSFEGGRQNARLRKDVQGHLREMEHELAGVQQSAEAVGSELRMVQRELTHAKQAVDHARRAKSDARRVEATQRAELDNVESRQVEAPPAADVSNQDDAAVLEEEIHELQHVADEKARLEAEAQEKLDAAKAAYDALREANAAKIEAVEAAVAAWDAAAVRKNEVETEFRQIQDAVREKESEAAGTRVKLKAVHNELAKILASAAEVCSEDEGAAAKQNLEELWRKANRLKSSAELARLMQKEQLVARLSKLKNDIRRQEGDAGGTFEAMELERNSGLKWCLASQTKLEAELDRYKSLKKALGKRAEKQSEIRDHTAQQLQLAFNKNLRKRAWVGEVHIDHDTGKLVIKVKMEGAKTAHQDLKTLSGGERSFITICFLLALGKQLQAMFHCLDEFDVFMDSISQGRSMMMLMEFAALQLETQLILLTPQSLSAIKQAEATALENRATRTWPVEKFIRIKQLLPAMRDGMRGTQQA